MKKSIFLVICSLAIFNLHGQQDHSACDSLYLKTKSVIKSDDPCLIITVNYILEHPLVGNPQIYNDYIGFILTWMDKTPEYTFNLNDKILTLCKDDNLLLFNVYLACLAKTAIETKKNDVPAALKLLVIYLERTDNKVRRTSKIKKMIQDVKEGKVEKYI